MISIPATSRTLSLALWGVAAVVTVPALSARPAHAQSQAVKARALEAYNKGTIQYNLGKWQAAIQHFEEAFETFPDPAFLFNIAQSHRQAGDCKKASFFYKRYLALKPEATNREEVEGFVSELESGCTTPSAQTPDPSTTTSGPATTETAGTETQVANASEPGASVQAAPRALSEPDGPTLLVAHASLGSALLFAGDELDTPPQLSFAFGAGYPIKLGTILVDAGVLLSYTPVAWEVDAASGTTSFTSLLANVGASVELLSSLSARAEVGAGLMVVSGLGEASNVFTEDAMSADDPALGASFRMALGVELALTESLMLTAQPVVLSVAPAPSGMRSSIESLNSYQALFGIGYKL